MEMIKDGYGELDYTTVKEKEIEGD